MNKFIRTLALVFVVLCIQVRAQFVIQTEPANMEHLGNCTAPSVPLATVNGVTQPGSGKGIAKWNPDGLPLRVFPNPSLTVAFPEVRRNENHDIGVIGEGASTFFLDATSVLGSFVQGVVYVSGIAQFHAASGFSVSVQLFGTGPSSAPNRSMVVGFENNLGVSQVLSYVQTDTNGRINGSLATGSNFFFVARFTVNLGGTSQDSVELWINPCLSGGVGGLGIPNASDVGDFVVGLEQVRVGVTHNASLDQLRVASHRGATSPTAEDLLFRAALTGTFSELPGSGSYGQLEASFANNVSPQNGVFITSPGVPMTISMTTAPNTVGAWYLLFGSQSSSPVRFFPLQEPSLYVNLGAPFLYSMATFAALIVPIPDSGPLAGFVVQAVSFEVECNGTFARATDAIRFM